MENRERADLVLSASWVVPVEPAGCVLEDHALAVRGGSITALGPADEIDARFSTRERVHLDGHALVPGFVNAHTHAAMTLFRGLADDLPLDTWLAEHIWPAEAKFVDEAFVRAGTRLAIAEMLRGGTTCFNDMYFFPDVAGEVARDAGIRAVLGLIVLDAPTAWAADRDSYFSRGLEVHEAFRGDSLVTTAFAPHAPYTVGDEAFERVRELSERLDLPVHIHLHETAREVEDAVRETGERPFARLSRLGLVNPRLAAVHMTDLLPGEIEELADRGASVLHCPESNLKLASGVCPVPRLAAAGVNLALGTDGAASNNDLDMPGEMRTAALLGKLAAGDATALPRCGRAPHGDPRGGPEPRARRPDREPRTREVGGRDRHRPPGAGHPARSTTRSPRSSTPPPGLTCARYGWPAAGWSGTAWSRPSMRPKRCARRGNGEARIR